MNCNEAMAALAASLENGTTLTDEQRGHIRTCERCRVMLSSAKEALRMEPVEVPIDAAVAAAEKEVARKRIWRIVKTLIAIGLLGGIALAGVLVQRGEAEAPEALLIVGGGLLVALLLAIPFFAIAWVVRGTTRGLYKRLGPGRVLSGVCLGIAEASKMDVRLLRIIIVVLLFFDGAGFWLYLLLALAMPVHPDDRQYLLRFRLRRWWQRRTSHATGG